MSRKMDSAPRHGVSFRGNDGSSGTATPVSNEQARVAFYFNGRSIEALPQDTVASALYRSGRRTFSRSFKYHRPRGLLCVSGRCPNCLMNVDGTPNVRACMQPVQDGMQVIHQNASPSLETDFMAIAEKFSWAMPVGFYYKTFTHPWMWHLAEPFIRRAAGLGKIDNDPNAVTDHPYEHVFLYTTTAVVGGGPYGIRAALEAAEQGEQVVLIDDQPALGGYLRYTGSVKNTSGTASHSDTPAEGEPTEGLDALVKRVNEHPNITVFTNATCFGLYEGRLLGIAHKNPDSSVAQRVTQLRTERIVVATGAYEVPVLFENNDLPGVMLSTGALRLLGLHGVTPGERAVVVGSTEAATSAANELESAGVEVTGVVPPDQVVKAVGRKHVTALQTAEGQLACDLVVVCGDWVPDAGLVAQAGGTVAWNEKRSVFATSDLPEGVSAVGAVTGESLPPAVGLSTSSAANSKKVFVCPCEDVSLHDLKTAITEGFDHIETLKRYTTTTMGPCQGKMCQQAAISICAEQTGQTIQETGRTTSRPPTSPIPLGALAGPHLHPVKRTPMHAKHDEIGCVWMDMGEWKRPLYYGTPDSKRESVEQEYWAVRQRVGLIDLSTLGKLDVVGSDAGKLLDKVYTNRFSDLRVGRARYGVICDEAGIILDDGTVSRVAEDRYFITTTTGNIEFVQEWLEWWLAGTGMCVHITNVTGGMAAVNVAGPKARDTLAKLTDRDLSNKRFGYMRCRQAEVAGVPSLMLRIGFVGETGWEIHFPAEYGEHVWDAILEAGAEFDIRPFGVETQRVLRLEKKHVIVSVDTDATSNPIESDLAWVAKLDKDDFIGKAAISRAKDRAPREKLVGFTMDEDVLPPDGCVIIADGQPAGRITSVRFSPVNERIIGLAWVSAGLAVAGQTIEMRVDGRPVTAKIADEPFYDPAQARLRQ
ncbi:MAG: 2Fe-2S iron-sulfur cluster-binding protein [Chloroflexota bacterium]|nr:2Fe-2S iron-sulfur cluster-binding protein [Chloroflexota bacterium]